MRCIDKSIIVVASVLKLAYYMEKAKYAISKTP